MIVLCHELICKISFFIWKKSDPRVFYCSVCFFQRLCFHHDLLNVNQSPATNQSDLHLITWFVPGDVEELVPGLPPSWPDAPDSRGSKINSFIMTLTRCAHENA